jgi:hypothetical protein
MIMPLIFLFRKSEQCSVVHLFLVINLGRILINHKHAVVLAQNA